MRLLHTSDWHLGMTLRGGMSYLNDQQYVINEICRIAVDKNVDAILLAGDVFDRSIASGEALNLCNSIFTYICSTLNIKLFVIAGNHDSAERISQYSELLKGSGLIISGALTAKTEVYNYDDVDIYMLPWISTDKVKSVFAEETDRIETMEAAYGYVLDRFRADFKKGHKNILISHAFVGGSMTSTSDRAAEVGRATMVSSSVFDGFDYVALGHLHGPQKITDSIRYSGTPMAYSFGKEEKQEKSVVIIDTATMIQEIVPIPQLRRHITLEGTYEELLKADYPEDILDSYIRLIVNDSFVGVEMMSALREKYRNLCEVTGKSLENEEGRITMSIEELQDATADPMQVFFRYCEDIMSEAPSGHIIELFKNAVGEYETEVTEK